MLCLVLDPICTRTQIWIAKVGAKTLSIEPRSHARTATIRAWKASSAMNCSTLYSYNDLRAAQCLHKTWLRRRGLAKRAQRQRVTIRPGIPLLRSGPIPSITQASGSTKYQPKEALRRASDWDQKRWSGCLHRGSCLGLSAQEQQHGQSHRSEKNLAVMLWGQ